MLRNKKIISDNSGSKFVVLSSHVGTGTPLGYVQNTQGDGTFINNNMEDTFRINTSTSNYSTIYTLIVKKDININIKFIYAGSNYYTYIRLNEEELYNSGPSGENGYDGKLQLKAGDLLEILPANHSAVGTVIIY